MSSQQSCAYKSTGEGAVPPPRDVETPSPDGVGRGPDREPAAAHRSPRPAARRLRRGTGVPLWQQLHDDLLRRLRRGEFTDGVPGEFALAAYYAVSRQTVRQALRGLREAGLVDAGRGRRSTPAVPAELSLPMGALQELFAALRGTGGAVHSVVRTLRVGPDAVIGARIGAGEAAPLVYLQRLWLVGERPLALDHAWWPEAVAAPVLAADLTTVDVYGELAATAGVRLVSGREWLHAVVPSAAQRALLHMAPHVAAVAVDRLGRAANGPVEWRHSVIRGDRFTVGSDFAARTGYRMHVRAAPPRH